jgi:hypothetical protein
MRHLNANLCQEFWYMSHVTVVEDYPDLQFCTSLYRVTRLKRNPYLRWENFKIESKQMIDICFGKFGNTVKPETVFYDVTKLKKQIS